MTARVAVTKPSVNFPNGTISARCDCGWIRFYGTESLAEASARVHSCRLTDIAPAITRERCRCLDTVSIRNMAGRVVRHHNPCSLHNPPRPEPVAIGEPKPVIDVPKPAPMSMESFAAAGWDGAIQELERRKAWTAPPEVAYAPPPVDTTPHVLVWRSKRWGWHGELRAGYSQLERWWRPFRRLAEYRGSYVHLRHVEHSDRERVS